MLGRICFTQGVTTMPVKRRSPALAWRLAALATLLVAGLPPVARAEEPAPPAQPAQEGKPSVEVYGFGMGDAIADFKQNNPDWYDVVRPSKLPSVANQYGQDGHFYLSARQSRFGTRATIPTS